MHTSIISAIITAVLFAVGLGGTALAADAIQLNMVAEEEVEVINEDGEKEIQYIKPDSVIPGDVVRYTLHYHNTGNEPADDIVITNPIPAHMEYINASVRGSGSFALFSADGGQHFDTAAKLTVTEEDGSTRPASAADYTHIQWHFKDSLAPDAQGSVGYRARLQ